MTKQEMKNEAIARMRIVDLLELADLKDNLKKRRVRVNDDA